MNILLLVLSVLSFQNQASRQAATPDVPVAPLNFRIAVVNKKCVHCVIIMRTLTNKSKMPVALPASGTTFITTIAGDATNVSSTYSGTASMSIGDSLSGEQSSMQCTILRPGESFTSEATIEFPPDVKSGSSISVQQSYSNFVQSQCNGTDLFYGVSKSNRLKVSYK